MHLPADLSSERFNLAHNNRIGITETTAATAFDQFRICIDRWMRNPDQEKANPGWMLCSTKQTRCLFVGIILDVQQHQIDFRLY